jgi:hypothetical protein
VELRCGNTPYGPLTKQESSRERRRIALIQGDGIGARLEFDLNVPDAMVRVGSVGNHPKSPALGTLLNVATPFASNPVLATTLVPRVLMPRWQTASPAPRSHARTQVEILLLPSSASKPPFLRTSSRLSFKTIRALPARALATLGAAMIFNDEVFGEAAGAGRCRAAPATGVGFFGAETPARRRLRLHRARRGANVKGLLMSSVVPVITLPFT